MKRSKQHLLALLPLAISQAYAQTSTPPAAPESNTVVVTGYRASLQSSLAAKRESDTIVDVIKAEDIGKFPDNNLSEAMQRIPGVAIDRDAGEGRTITVRGLSGLFVRTKLNGMEALATTGGRDSSGGANRDRGFDYNVFAAELFSAIKVSKAASAEQEEGSLGATIDLTTPRPFDYPGFAAAASVTGQYNDLSKKANRRETFMLSTRSDDKRWGVMLSVADSTNDKLEEGPSTGRWENASLSTVAGVPSAQSTGMRFKSYSTDGGLSFIPIPFLAKTNANAGSLADLSGEALNISKALHPRIPRYGHIEYDVKRLGITSAVQFKPVQGTLLTLDLMHSNYVANRNEQYLEAISFSRGDGNAVGNPSTSIYNYMINSKGEIQKASFNNVDIRSESRHDELESSFNQMNLTLNQKLGDRAELRLFAGKSNSAQRNPEQTTLTLDAYDVQGYSYDYSNPLKPVFNYGKLNGCTVDQACYWQISSSAAKGDPSLVRIRPNRTDNGFNTQTADLSYELNDHLTLKTGVGIKRFSFKTVEARLASENIPANAAAFLNANLSNYVMPQTMGTGYGAQTWLIPNFNAIKSALNFGCNCVVSPLTGSGLPTTSNDFTVSNTVSSARGNNQDASEKDSGYYAQLDFNYELFGIPVRGNTGMRIVKTEQATTAYLSLPAKNGVTPPPTYQTATQSYTDHLPSLNITGEVLKNVLLRFGTSKVMSRPSLQALTPAGSIDLDKRTYSGGNPTLEPIRGTTYDLNLEWYKDKDSLFSVGYFFKNMKSYIQRTAHTDTFGSLGLDPALGAASGIDASTPFSITNWVNTPGGLIRGFEVNLQKNFDFLPAPFNNFGGVLNFTKVESKLKYILSPTSPTVTVADLLGMSPKSANATLYYETKDFSARITGAYRSKYTYILLPGSGSDFQGKNATTNVDAQISYNLTPKLTLTVQALNLTDQYDDRFNAYNNATFGNYDGNAPSDAVHTGRSYYIGLRYKY
ncbi:TonB-dependent receptor [Massilia sp. TS11]|uniref:TonB-dependent receptor n=1 Tax=Massilia sp. TS11 TaxID=2908003 RepID=UPI001EDC43B8|nr:TonB-dependent receptor [Massilia sp. TS11]MCG2583822.1 TonB-dependent receptor [Massilia sp. TS11]